MVKIVEEEEQEEDEEEEEAYPNPTNHHSHHPHNYPSTTTSPPPTAAPSSPPPRSSTSSISSEHTFHGFSPLHQTQNPLSPSPSPPSHTPAQLPVPVVANRLVRDQPEVVTKTELDAETGLAGEVAGGGGMRRRERRQLEVLSRARGEKVAKRAGLGFRVCEFVVCLVSFSVMLADKNRGWALDSFDRYIEFRYSMSVNVIGFAYSGLQGLDLLIQLTTGRNLSHSKLRYYFDFGMDQILAYLLLSASTSAFTRIDDWISNWGHDKFPAMASASVGVSFLAFAAFASSSLISGYILCTHRFA